MDRIRELADFRHVPDLEPCATERKPELGCGQSVISVQDTARKPVRECTRLYNRDLQKDWTIRHLPPRQ